MTASVSVIGPGWRALTSAGAIIEDATLYFYEEDGTTPLEVFSNSALSTSLGTSVDCDSGGYPATSGNAKTLIYTGIDPYDVVCKNGSGSTIWSHESVKGALDTSSFVTDPDITGKIPVVATAID